LIFHLQCHFETCFNGVYCLEPRLCRLELYNCEFLDVPKPALLHKSMGPRAVCKNNTYSVSQEFLEAVGSSSESSASSGESECGFADRLLIFLSTSGENMPLRVQLEAEKCEVLCTEGEENARATRIERESEKSSL